MSKKVFLFSFYKLKYFLADYREVGGVGGAVVLKQDDAGQHHVDEDQPAAAESWSLVRTLHSTVGRYFTESNRKGSIPIA